MHSWGFALRERVLAETKGFVETKTGQENRANSDTNCDQIDQEQILIVTERVKRIVELEQGLIVTMRQAKLSRTRTRTSEQEQNGSRESC